MPADLPAVLVVDDEVRSQEALRRTLEEDFTVFTAGSAADAQAIMEREFVQIVLCDQRMPGASGVEFLKLVRMHWPDTVRIVISGYTDAQDIIAGINEAGIWQYLLKPWQPDHLLHTLRSAAELWRLQQDNQRLALELRTSPHALKAAVRERRAQAKAGAAFERIVRDPGGPLDAVCSLAERVAAFDLPILITGESGTGKELLARAVHYASPRADSAFVVENCAALPDSLLEAELFGHKRGAFTGAVEDRIGLFPQADGGTIFLDEIGETSPAFQVKLLRVLQEGEVRPVGSPRPIAVDVRVIATTNRDMEEEVRQGRFREDLYWRLAGISLRVPPLRERPADIVPIAESLRAQAQSEFGMPVRGFSPEALQCMRAYRWPGNVREMRNEVKRMVVLADGECLGADLFSPRVVLAAGEAAEERELSLLAGLDGGLKERMEQLEARVIKEALVRHRWNKTRAADELGLSRVGLRSKLSRYGLKEP